MSTILVDVPVSPFGALTLEVPGEGRMSDAAFAEFCERNPDLRIEMDRHGNVIVMAPILPESGNREARLITQLQNWADQDGRGVVFSSSTMFHLPDGAIRSPDASWTPREAAETLFAEGRDAGRGQPPRHCPYFVLELRSATDRLPPLLAKMEEWIENGAALGILVDPDDGTVRLFRPGQETQLLEPRPERVSAEPEMPGLEFDLTRIW